MELFTVTCTTCHARLKVRDTEAIGQLLLCPKCHSMVQVAPPPGWQPPPQQAEAGEAVPADDAATPQAAGPPQAAADSSASHAPTAEAAQALDAKPASPEGAPQHASEPKAAPAKSAQPRRSVWAAEPYDHRQGRPPRAAKSQSPAQAVAAEQPKEDRQTPEASAPLSAAVAGHSAQAAPAEQPTSTLQQPDDASFQPSVAPAEATDRRVLLWTTAPLTAAVVSVVVWGWLSSPADKPAIMASAHSGKALPASASNEPQPAAVRTTPAADRHWIAPGSAAVLVSRRPAAHRALLESHFFPPRVQAQRDIDQFLDATADADPQAGPLIVSLPALSDDAGPTLLALFVQMTDRQGEQPPARQSSGWREPIELIDNRLLLSGKPEMVAEAIAGAQLAPRDAELASLLDELGGEYDLVLALHASAISSWTGSADAHLLGRWSQAAAAWDTLRRACGSVGLAVRTQGRVQSLLILRGESPSSAEQLHEAVSAFLASVETALAQEPRQTLELLRAGQVDRASAASADWLAAALLSALRSRRVELDGRTVRVALAWESELTTLLSAGKQSTEALAARKTALADQINEHNYRELLESMAGYDKAEGSLPMGAAGSALLPAESRLSWLAMIAPYLGHLDWQRQLAFGRPWNDAANQPITRRPLEQVINPLLGPMQTPSGYPVTHVAALAGVGSDAADLPADHARAGLFGSNRQMPRSALGDGASHTIALVGVVSQLGPWAQGGPATLRAFTQQPYVNGPDGIGTGQSDGMLVGMADGSVRFIAADVDPSVLEMLASANDGRRLQLPLQEVAQPRGGNRQRAAEAMVVLPEERPSQRPAPSEPSAELQRRLDQNVAGLQMTDVALVDLVRLLEQLGGMSIQFDMRSLEAEGVSLRTPVSVEAADTTIGRLLEQVAGELGLAAKAIGDQLVLTRQHPSSQPLEEAEYSVADLLAVAGAEGQQLAELLQAVIAPDTWTGNDARSGHGGEIELLPGKLNVRHQADVQNQVERLLEQLRAVAPPSADGLFKPGGEVSRWAQAAPLLATPITVTFREPSSLERIAAYLHSETKADVVLDHLALADAGHSRETPAVLVANDRPLGEALDELLAPLGLTLQAWGPTTLEITSLSAAGQAPACVEVYGIADLLHASMTAEQFAARLVEEVSPATWKGGGGSGVLAVWGDSALVVREDQLVQRDVQRKLSEWRAAAE